MKYLLLPPASLLLLAFIGYFLLKLRPKLGHGMIIAALLALFLLSTPVAATRLLAGLQNYPAIDPGTQGNSAAGAIVVLSANLQISAPEFGPPQPGSLSLERLRYAAFLKRATGLPILISGGIVHPDTGSLASLMAASLESDFATSADWLEERSLNTQENADYSAKILATKAIDTIFLVTHSWHMPRAKRAFERNAIKVIPAPTGFTEVAKTDSPDSWIPKATALARSSYALHERIGSLWYWLAQDLLGRRNSQ